jgi:hypothetical protein
MASCPWRDDFINTALRISQLGDFFPARVHAVSFQTVPLLTSRPRYSPFCFSVFLCYMRAGIPVLVSLSFVLSVSRDCISKFSTLSSLLFISFSVDSCARLRIHRPLTFRQLPRTCMRSNQYHGTPHFQVSFIALSCNFPRDMKED